MAKDTRVGQPGYSGFPQPQVIGDISLTRLAANPIMSPMLKADSVLASNNRR